ncbi:MAG: L-serine ammonia-lyase, iron-sulfur-dependent, subunit alpha [Oscillospiraceae bacterium]|nr:L-serine ammonia-lyase, iron-sulfur-dependent, subunit alpha [Oscillospiraceae bacterium]
MNSFERIISIGNTSAIPLWRVILNDEIHSFGTTEEAVFKKLDNRYEIMRRASHRAEYEPLSTAGGLISGVTAQAKRYADEGRTLCGDFISKVIVKALSGSEANAAMGRICACPTAGSCGIVPAVLVTLEEEKLIERRKILEALLLASGFGAIVTENATVAGAEGGCQAECGVAAAMAAAAATYLMGGTDDMAVNAFSIALMNVMGLVCDPVAGLVQIPCAQRNASQAVNALVSADLALGGMTCPVSPDEMVETMYSVGQMLPRELRETALGGMAATESAKKIEAEIFG